MPLTQAQIQAAQAVQYAAAHDQAQQVRLVAGPGTGKSSAIEERVRWLTGCAGIVSCRRSSTLRVSDLLEAPKDNQVLEHP